MSDVKNIILVGVGGQGTILASKILSEGLAEAGYDVKMSEIHGMSQRGGSVSTQIRYGKEVYSPIVGAGEADILVAFEIVEAARYMPFAKPDAKIIINNYRILSPEVISGAEDYPEDTIEVLSKAMDVTVIDAAKIAEDLGNARAMNIVLLGALVKSLGLTDIDWNSIIAARVKPAIVELNQKALAQGMAQI